VQKCQDYLFARRKTFIDIISNIIDAGGPESGNGGDSKSEESMSPIITVESCCSTKSVLMIPDDFQIINVDISWRKKTRAIKIDIDPARKTNIFAILFNPS
jgi:hypothetical protein